MQSCSHRQSCRYNLDHYSCTQAQQASRIFPCSKMLLPRPPPLLFCPRPVSPTATAQHQPNQCNYTSQRGREGERESHCIQLFFCLKTSSCTLQMQPKKESQKKKLQIQIQITNTKKRSYSYLSSVCVPVNWNLETVVYTHIHKYIYIHIACLMYYHKKRPSLIIRGSS